LALPVGPLGRAGRLQPATNRDFFSFRLTLKQQIKLW
jgi:hypothetical protein